MLGVVRHIPAKEIDQGQRVSGARILQHIIAQVTAIVLGQQKQAQERLTEQGGQHPVPPKPIITVGKAKNQYSQVSANMQPRLGNNFGMVPLLQISLVDNSDRVSINRADILPP